MGPLNSGEKSRTGRKSTQELRTKAAISSAGISTRGAAQWRGLDSNQQNCRLTAVTRLLEISIFCDVTLSCFSSRASLATHKIGRRQAS